MMMVINEPFLKVFAGLVDAILVNYIRHYIRDTIDNADV